MNHQFSNKFTDYDSSGPRPPIPGQDEPRSYKMTDNAQRELHLLMTSSSSSQSSSSPSCLKWARTLSSLLEDRDGVNLFKRYVEQEGGIHNDRLSFYFACEGLKQQSDGERVKQIIGAIYRFLKKSELPLPEYIHQIVKQGLKDENFVLTPDIFDQMQQDVERIINETTYPNFLQSDMYLQYVQSYHSAIERGHPLHEPFTTNITTATSTSISEASLKFLSRSSTLPTLHEEGDGSAVDLEGAVGGFDTSTRVPTLSSSSSSSMVPMPLTKNALMKTQRNRLETRPPGSAHGYYHNNYNSYNPVSRRDSELASLSSGRTDSDTMSISSKSADGRPQRKAHQHQYSVERKMIRESAAANVESRYEIKKFIPRPDRPNAVPKMPKSPQEFLSILIPKLEALKKEREKDEIVRCKLQEVEQKKNTKLFVDAITAKLVLDDGKDDQDILDEHVSRIWNDRTPHRSPGNISPSSQFPRRRTNEMAGGTGVGSNMLKTRWGSFITDSGISGLSYDTMTFKHKDTSTSATKSQRTQMPPPDYTPPAAHSKMAQQLEDIRRSQRYQQQPPLPQKNVAEPPPLPAKNFSQPASISGSSSSTAIDYSITVVCSFCDEAVPYRIKIPGKNPPTLKQFKEYLPKKGNYRYFFKTHCDDNDNPIIQEEMCNDSDVLPLFEGKIVATVKLAN